MSRAHGIVQRRSENVGLEVVLDTCALGNSVVKAALSRVNDAAREGIVGAGFRDPPIMAKNANRNVSFEVWCRDPEEVQGPLQSHVLVGTTL